jgi:hypothetical protein
MQRLRRFMSFRTRLIALFASVILIVPLAGAAAYSLSKRFLGGTNPAYAHEPVLTPVRVGPAELKLRSSGGKQYRLLLDAAALDAVRAAANSQSQAWRIVQAHCDTHLEGNTKAGYEAFNWADAIAELSLCWHGSEDERYASGALRYLNALLDDRERIGDGKGGARTVRHDSGYGIRTFGVYSAIAYDWLRDAPGMTPELKRKIIERLTAWLDWYKTDGYLNGEPISNYFWGYFTALTFAGFAVADDAPQGRRWLEYAHHELLEKKVLPTFKTRLKGGDWPEGWQYGELVAMHAAFVAETYRTAAGVEVARKFDWLRDVVKHHTHALLPSGDSVYGGGTWTEHPAKASALAMNAISIALRGIDENRAAEARFLAKELLPSLERERAWVALLADRADEPVLDPRSADDRSQHIVGTGLTLMRSDWSSSAVFASFKVGPRLAVDHQDKDEGHFELWRGRDGLLVDAGDSEGSATINHNSLLIDDGGRILTYAPNQGVWGKEVRTTRYADDGNVAVAAGEFADAYLPGCVRQGCRKRAVERATRTLVYLRPALVVVEDRVELQNGRDGVSFAVHVAKRPQRNARRTSAVVGSSRVDIQTLEPRDAAIVTLEEPTTSGPPPHRNNSVWGPLWRVEVRSPRGTAERRFVHWIVAGPANTTTPIARAVQGQGLSGALGSLRGGHSAAILFAEHPDQGGRIELSAQASDVVITNLAPDRTFRVVVGKADTGCSVRVEPDDKGQFRANSGGFLRVAGCGWADGTD